MPLVTAKNLQASYDVVIVGSGAGGAQAAYTLTLAGAKVLLLEAGRFYDPVSETPMFQTPVDAPLRAAPTPDKSRGFFHATVNGGWTIDGEPYSSDDGDPLQRFSWWRARMLGGRTNAWERAALRQGPYDFKPASRDGLGFDWPLTYEELSPYYDRVERLIGVFGESEGLENSPDSPAGVLLPPPKLRLAERLAQARAKSLGIPFVPIHRAVLTQRQDHQNLPALLHPGDPRAQALLSASMQARSACFWATPCERGCSIKAAYQSSTVHLPPALASGNLDLLCNARAHRLEKDRNGTVSCIHFIDTTDGSDHLVRARAFVLAASAFESVRLLFNSGLCQEHGLLGKRLMNTVGQSVLGQIPLLEDLPPFAEDGAGGSHAYAPWWLLQEQKEGKLDFPRGYHIEFSPGRQMPNVNTGTDLEWLTGGTYGKSFKEAVRRTYGSFISFSGRGEMIPNDRTYCEIDPSAPDRWGIPTLRIHWHWSDYEQRQSAHMQATFRQLIEAMGGRVKEPLRDFRSIQPLTHEVGGACMGTEPRNSVTNAFGMCWEAKNVIVADGAVFCSSPDKNPTLTIMALAWRACDHLLEQLKQHNL